MQNPMIAKIAGVVETALYVDDLDRAKEFYQRVFGFRELMGDPGRLCALQVGDSQVLLLFQRGGTLEWKQLPGGHIPPHDGHGRLHFAFGISLEQVDAWRERLRSKGVEVISEVRWEPGGQSLYFHDPDGNVGELITPRCWAFK